MIRFLMSALAIRNFKSSQGRVKRLTAVDAAMKCPSGELTWPARLLKSNRLGDNGDCRRIRAPAQRASSRLAHFLVRRRRCHGLVLLCPKPIGAAANGALRH